MTEFDQGFQSSPQHIVVSVVRNSVDVWRHFSFTFVLVAGYNMGVVYWKPFVGIDGDTEKTLMFELYFEHIKFWSK